MLSVISLCFSSMIFFCSFISKVASSTFIFNSTARIRNLLPFHQTIEIIIEIANKAYNEEIQLYTLSSAIRDLLVNPNMYPQFRDVIINHFKLKKDYILTMCDKWTKDVSKPYKDRYNDIILEIQMQLDKF